MTVAGGGLYAVNPGLGNWRGWNILEFRMQSQRLADLMRATLDEQGLFLGQLSRVFSNRGVILTRPDFHDLVQELLRRFPTIQAVEWAPRVTLDERAAFETACGQPGILLIDAVSRPDGPGIILIVLRMGTYSFTLADSLASILQLRFVEDLAAY